mgnify:CR=1 FL=1
MSAPAGSGGDSLPEKEGSVAKEVTTLGYRTPTPILAAKSSLAWRIPLAAKERIWKGEFIDIFSLLMYSKDCTDTTAVTGKEEERGKR